MHIFSVFSQTTFTERIFMCQHGTPLLTIRACNPVGREKNTMDISSGIISKKKKMKYKFERKVDKLNIRITQRGYRTGDRF